MEFNAVLDRESRPENLHERFLERKLEELDGLDAGRGARYWLTMARITELTLLCAGTYADSGALTAAGDPMLINTYHTLCQPEGATPGQKLAARFIDFVASGEGQELIQNYGKDRYGEALYNDAAYARQFAD